MTQPIGHSLADQVREYKQQQVAELRELFSVFCEKDTIFPEDGAISEPDHQAEHFYVLLLMIMLSFEEVLEKEDPERPLTEARFNSIKKVNASHVKDYMNPPQRKDVYFITG